MNWNWRVKLDKHPDAKWVSFRVEYSKDMQKLLLIGMVKFDKMDLPMDVTTIEVDPNQIQDIDQMSEFVYDLLNKTLEKGNEVRRIHEIMQNIKIIEIDGEE